MNLNRPNANDALQTRNRSRDVVPQSGICSRCLDGCKGNCDMFKATFRGRELLYPEPFGSVTAGADKDYPVDYSHLNIMGYALGAKGVEPDPDKATFPNVDTATEYGVRDKVRMKVPIFTGALGSTDIARSAASAWCAGKMFAGLIPNWKSATMA
jgi:glutamate synthase domain-containing protein 2